MTCLCTTGFILAVSNCEYFHICTWCRDVYLLGILQRPRCVFVGCYSAQYQSDEFNPFQLNFIGFFYVVLIHHIWFLHLFLKQTNIHDNTSIWFTQFVFLTFQSKQIFPFFQNSPKTVIFLPTYCKNEFTQIEQSKRLHCLCLQKYDIRSEL